MSRPWFRFYRRTVNNPKAQRLRPELFRAWVNILCATDDAGNVPSLNDLAFTLRVGEALVNKWLGELVDARLLGRDGASVTAHDWAEHQFESDVSTDRVKRFRQRSGSGGRNAPEIEADTEQKKLSPGGREFWAENQKVPDQWLRLAEQERQRLKLPEIDTLVAASKFERWHSARQVQPRTFTEWQSAWVNFVLDEKAQNGTPRQPRDSTSGPLHRIARLAQEARAEENLRQG